MLSGDVLCSVPATLLPVAMFTHEQKPVDGLHCLDLKLPSSLQSGGEPPTNVPLYAAKRC